MNDAGPLIDQQALNAALVQLGRHARLLVVSDFDGTISEFAERPQDAVLDQVAQVALRKLSEAPNTFVAVISGRPLSDLAMRFRDLERVRLVGSHGHEFDIDAVCPLDEGQRSVLGEARRLVASAVARVPGAVLEEKPHGVAFHFRAVSSEPRRETEDLRSALMALGSGLVRSGNNVLEFSAVHTNKGHALSLLREQIAPTVTLFIGDDCTDEAAFSALRENDIGIKVGQGETCARMRVASTTDAVVFLARLAEQREEWARSAVSEPIDSHLFLSDQRTVALVDKLGRVSWLCAPRIDASPVFGYLVGGPSAGHFTVCGEGAPSQRYFENALVGQTIFGSVSVTDFLDMSGGRAYQRAGRSDLVRIIEGAGTVRAEFAPKFNFGRVPTRITKLDRGLRIDCGHIPIVLFSPQWEWEIARVGMHDEARSEFRIGVAPTSLRLLIGTASMHSDYPSAADMLQGTIHSWASWLATLRLPEFSKELVARSSLVLKGLCYGPTGAIAAAATTSLPETIGGERNWDYRYCWPRDSSMAASALVRLGAQGPAMRLLDWLLSLSFDSQDEAFLAPLYTVTGRVVMGEAEVPEALGYRGSRPVRIGNLAATQLQLDTLAPIAELMDILANRGGGLTTEHVQLAEYLVSLVRNRWRDPDSGIWEIRGAPRHYVHSKLMCWYTVDCCMRVSRYLGTEKSDWAELADCIRNDIESNGFSEELGSYKCAYDLAVADAASLWVILARFHPPDHPRARGTLRCVMDRLVHDGGVFRYHFDDSLRGKEGEFIICRSWLIEALIMSGEREQARELFEQLVSRVSALGLLSEQWDATQQRALGNYPQAYSHLGLVNAAVALSQS